MTTPVENATRTTQSILGLIAKAKQTAEVVLEDKLSEVCEASPGSHKNTQVLHEANQNIQHSQKRLVSTEQ